MIVGCNIKNHISERNVIGILNDSQYCQVKDIFSIKRLAASALYTITKKEVLPVLDFINQYKDFNINNVTILHFINSISYGKTPWITTFETIIPRFKSVSNYLSMPTEVVQVHKIRLALKALAGKSCKQCIAMSNCTANVQKVFLEQFPEYQSEIEQKLIVLHPPQAVSISGYVDKLTSLDHALKFILVGGAFFRKGGIEVIETFEELRREFGYNIQLTIVSSLTIDPYATHETVADVRRVQKFIDWNRDWIQHYPKLDNQRVLELMKQSHIGLLPTYADTYGFSVLELQATGCPVITTDVRAMPEINHDDWGWIISIPKNSLGEAIYQTAQDRQTISKLIRQGLEEIMHEIFADRTVIVQKAEKAIARIQSDHSPGQYAERLREIYLRSVAP